MRLGVTLCASCFTVLFRNGLFRLTLTRQKQNDITEGYVPFMYVSAHAAMSVHMQRSTHAPRRTYYIVNRCLFIVTTPEKRRN